MLWPRTHLDRPTWPVLLKPCQNTRNRLLPNINFGPIAWAQTGVGSDPPSWIGPNQERTTWILAWPNSSLAPTFRILWKFWYVHQHSIRRFGANARQVSYHVVAGQSGCRRPESMPEIAKVYFLAGNALFFTRTVCFCGSYTRIWVLLTKKMCWNYFH